MNAETGRAQSTAPLQEGLEAYYHDLVDPGVQIVDLTPISDGWETIVYSFDAVWAGQPDPVILRLYPAADAVEKSTREFRGMRALKANGYPVPGVYYHETDAALLGKPFMIMERINGLPLGRVRWEDPAREPEYFTRLVQLLVDLHRLPTAPFAPLDPGDPADFLRNKLELGRALIVEQTGQRWAIPVLDWLDARVDDLLPSPLGVLHGDFHPYNILVDRSDQLAVIDWGSIEVGDTRYDLAWTLLLMATQRYPADHDRFLREYEQLSGQPVTGIAEFEVIAALRRLFGFAVTLTSGSESVGMRPEAADLMRAQKPHFERVYAVLRQHSGLALPEIEALLR